MDISKELQDKVFEVIEIAKTTGKVKKGTNESTKVIERGIAKLVVVAKDVNPPEVTMHLEPLCKEKGITCVEVDKKDKLGISVGLSIGCSSAAIIDAGDAEKDLEGFKAKKQKENK